jgi:hypothetical protein
VATHLHDLIERCVARRLVPKDGLEAHLGLQAVIVGVAHHVLSLSDGLVDRHVGIVLAVLVVRGNREVDL